MCSDVSAWYWSGGLIMSHNIAQIADGIDDQIAAITANIADSNQEIERLQALVLNLQADL